MENDISAQRRLALEYSYNRRLLSLMQNAKTEKHADEAINAILLFAKQAIPQVDTDNPVEIITAVLDAGISEALNEVMAFLELKYLSNKSAGACCALT